MHICTNPSLCPECRYLPSTEVWKIRRALNDSPGCHIKFNAWNYAEVENIRKLLTLDELVNITFSWRENKGDNMFDQRFLERFFNSKVLLQEKLAEVGKIPGSNEIENQLDFIQNRVDARIEQGIRHGIEEMDAMRHILNGMSKPYV
jgi:hypothetical protein